MIKPPLPQILNYITARYTYDPDIGNIMSKGKTIGTIRKDGRVIIVVRYGGLVDGTQLSYTTYGHQIGWYLTYGVWPDKFIDHIDGNPANNKLSNLRLATPGQNSHNTRKVDGMTTSKYKGVKKVNNRWRAYINYEGKRLHLGYHATEEEAALAYDTKAVEVFGLYAKCNFGTNSAVSSEMRQLCLPWMTE
jgi:hypothetical protein